MFEVAKNAVLRLLKVPPEPHPPFGDPASLKVFRAGKNYFKFRLFGWALAQTLALAGIVFWLVVFVRVEGAVQAKRSEPAAAPAPAAPPQTVDAVVKQATGVAHPPAGPGKSRPPRAKFDWAGFEKVLVQIGLALPRWAFPLVWALKIIGFLVYLVQLPYTYALRRLDYEMRWYVVTDRSLRIRSGLVRVQEITMSFANLQQVVVTRGPIQGLLGLADVRVQSAGGSSSGPREHNDYSSLHLGHFHGVENAEEIRDLILARLKRFRETGLGDPDEVRRPVASAPVAAPVSSELLAAAQELRHEARALRGALG